MEPRTGVEKAIIINPTVQGMVCYVLNETGA